MSVEFAVEPLKDAWNEFFCLKVDQSYEQGDDFCGLLYDDYLQKEKDGLLSICVARDNGEAVGYALTGAKNERFLLPRYRKFNGAVPWICAA